MCIVIYCNSVVTDKNHYPFADGIGPEESEAHFAVIGRLMGEEVEDEEEEDSINFG